MNLNLIPTISHQTFFKKVIRTSNPTVFTSCYFSAFNYTVGEIVNGGPCGIWGYKSINKAVAHNTNKKSTEAAIIQFEALKNARICKDGLTTYNIIGDVRVIKEIILCNEEAS